MKKDNYASLVVELSHRITGLRMICAVLLLCLVLISVKIFNLEVDQRTVIVPPEVNQSFWVEKDAADMRYIEQMARFHISQLETFSADVVRGQYDSIGQFFHPRVSSDWKAKLGARVKRIERDDISSVFYVNSTRVSGETAFLKGTLERRIGRRDVGKKEVTFAIEYRYENGKLWILGYSQVELNKTTDEYEVKEGEG